MSYLIHHGIKGQKWGVRRYQNPDGTYTELGKRQRRVGPSNFLTQNGTRNEFSKKYYNDVLNYAKHYHLKNLKSEQEEDADIFTKGFRRSTDGNDYTIKEGSVINRYSGNPNEDLHKRIYGSLSKKDKETYLDWAVSWNLPIDAVDGRHSVYKNEYVAVKDLKVAGAKKVREFISNNYASQKEKDISNFYSAYALGDKYVRQYIERYPYTGDDSHRETKEQGKVNFLKTAAKTSSDYGDFLYKAEKEHLQDIIDHFRDEKYDAIRDPVDADVARTAVILIDPYKSVKLKSSKYIFQW